MVRNRSCKALVDTGSEYTLIKHSVVKELGLTISPADNIPPLRSVTGSALKILGTTKLEILVSTGKEVKQVAVVVPEHYLDTDLLLGVDLLGRFPMTWDRHGNTFHWGDFTYSVYHMRTSNQVAKPVQWVKQEGENTSKNESGRFVRTSHRVTLPPHYCCVRPVKVKEPSGSLVLVKPESLSVQQEAPICAIVNDNQEIPIPFKNASKKFVHLNPGTLLATYSILTDKQISPVQSGVNLTKSKNPLSRAGS